MAEISSGKNYMSKRGKKGKMTNVPLGNTGHESSGKLTKKGQVYKNDLLDTDFTNQSGGAIRKKKGQ